MSSFIWFQKLLINTTFHIAVSQLCLTALRQLKVYEKISLILNVSSVNKQVCGIMERPRKCWAEGLPSNVNCDFLMICVWNSPRQNYNFNLIKNPVKTS